MNEFLRQNYFLLTYSVEFLAAVTGVFCYKKYRSTAAKYFIYFLVYSFFNDLAGNYPLYLKYLKCDFLIQDSLFEKNYLWGTLFWFIGSMLFYSFFYRRIFKSNFFKSILKISTLIVLVISIFQLFFNINILYNGYISTISIVSSLLIFMAITLYFIEVLQTDKIIYFYNAIYFYISSVLLIWWLITTPMIFYEIYFSTADWNFVFLKWQIYLFANIFMYVTFTFALIFCKPEND